MQTLFISPEMLEVATETLFISPEMLEVATETLFVSPEMLEVATETLFVSPEMLEVATETLFISPEMLEVATETFFVAIAFLPIIFFLPINNKLMPSFPKPQFSYVLDIAKEMKVLRDAASIGKLAIPKATATNLTIATWNIANLGEQHRAAEHLQLLAEIVSWFDVIAIQETKENYQDLEAIVQLLPKSYNYVLSDAAGNKERMAFVFNSKKLTLLKEVAELAIAPSDFKNVKLPNVTDTFNGFDRNPFMASFGAGTFKFTLLTAHLYYGDESPKSIDRRCLEAYCMARYADLRAKSKHVYEGITNVFVLGDLNLPKVDKHDKVYKALVAKGLQLPEHSTQVYSNISNDKMYDQIGFLPGSKNLVKSSGVFSFDNILFKDLYETKTATQFRSYCKYYISDHRPMWMELEIG
jgi:endonuclease/exonuclease/phosphatase family metal-dependent hydrolase